MYLLFLTTILSSGINECPKVNTMSNFNISEYIGRKWYIQKQQITSYLPKRENYCVTAKYEFSKKKIIGYDGIVLNVYNYANLDRVNGQNANKHNQILCARIPNNNVSSKLLVAPCFLPNYFGGDYWVIEAGPTSNNYEWALVSGGQPTVKYNDGCTTKVSGSNGAGLWFFSRTQVANNSIINQLNKIAIKNGFTLSQLNNVSQIDCNYN